MNDLTINQIKELKAEATNQITKILNDFTEITGVNVENVSLSKIHQMGKSEQQVAFDFMATI